MTSLSLSTSLLPTKPSIYQGILSPPYLEQQINNEDRKLYHSFIDFVWIVHACCMASRFGSSKCQDWDSIIGEKELAKLYPVQLKSHDCDAEIILKRKIELVLNKCMVKRLITNFKAKFDQLSETITCRTLELNNVQFIQGQDPKISKKIYRNIVLYCVDESVANLDKKSRKYKYKSETEFYILFRTNVYRILLTDKSKLRSSFFVSKADFQYHWTVRKDSNPFKKDINGLFLFSDNGFTGAIPIPSLNCVNDQPKIENEEKKVTDK